MSLPIKVFLDTNVFDSNYHDYEKGKLLRICQLVDEGKIELCISDVVVGEVKRHIKRNLSDARNAIRKSIKKELDKQGYESWNTGEQALRILQSMDKYKFLLELNNGLALEEMTQDAIAKFDAFLTSTRATVVESDGIDISAIISDYFEERPPFEDKKEKSMSFQMLL